MSLLHGRFQSAQGGGLRKEFGRSLHPREVLGSPFWLWAEKGANETAQSSSQLCSQPSSAV